MGLCVCVIRSHAYVHLSMSSGLQGIRTASYVMSLSHSLSSLSFTLIPVIHTVAVPVTPSFPLFPPVPLCLPCSPSFTPPAQSKGDLQITTLSMLSASHGREASLRRAGTRAHPHTRARNKACSVTLAVPVWAHPAGFSLFVSWGGGSGAWQRFIHRKRVREGKEHGELMVTVCSLSPGKTN